MTLPDQLTPTEAADAALSLAGAVRVLDDLSSAILDINRMAEFRLRAAADAAAEGGEGADRALAALQSEAADIAGTILATIPVVVARLEKARAALAVTLGTAAGAEVAAADAAFAEAHFGKAA